MREHRPFAMAPAVALLAAARLVAAQTLPTLRYEPPPDFYRSASTFPEQYESQQVNAGMQVYAFRVFRGDLLQTFRQGLLRDWIDPQFRETNISAPPSFSPANIPGAEAGIMGTFYENVAGLPKPHIRVAVYASGAVAIVDVSANSEASWRRAWPALQAALISLKVDAPNVAATSALPGSTAARASAGAVSGLFMGTKPKYMVDLQRGAGYGRFVPASHWYLFSGDGRVHRGYDDPVAPAGDVRRFDFDNARRTDPDNSGTYTVQGAQLILDMGTQGTERIVVPLEVNRLVINTVIYRRQ
jgi:hypothetical protein